ncbi:TetR/AcrR family transcriptional regulator [Streptomyces fuscichromogenes]|uniref:TetR/AcrR family transcriptional regulator n=1 Tax=Streptomyces fuscichromogenes TaxID=1324013 RepID=UPI0038290D85
MNGKTDRPRYTPELLVSVAARVFVERGYDGTSMADLARATGLAKSALYYHVQGKEQLLRLALERAVVPLLAFAEESGGPGRAVDRLDRLVEQQVRLLVDALPYVTLLLRVRGNTATERWALERRRAFDRCVAGLVRRAMDEGDLWSGADPRLVSRLLSGTVNSIVEWYVPPADGRSARDRADDLVRAVRRAIFGGLAHAPGPERVAP